MNRKDFDKLQADIKALTAKYLKTVEVADYHEDVDQLVEDVWLELLCKPVSEACEDRVYGNGDHGDK